MKKQNNNTKSMFDLEKLKMFVEQKGWSDPQLAKELGLDNSFVYRVMRGDRNAGKKFYEGLFRLCIREGLPLGEFFVEDDS